MRSFFTWFNNLYPVWLVGLATVAFLRPETMRWFDAPWIFGALAASMLCMELSLNLADFGDVRRNARAVVFDRAHALFYGDGIRVHAAVDEPARARDAFRAIVDAAKPR